ncbi:type II toxin-antitoxin system RelB/DinJ family antitoxin [Pasteurella skyensis]|uniref:Type II toxin-antitoxin system RelB/DinJ family antitoxin n=1 Tax=Phocoenobacter skyensis TaxID=97481 RepID=A0AAJ6P027_9PAST|nr:type II toxin-antitoxin system RelB/DinJ family antitoxin [Pasteurella skyensis]MDP8162076.1 type II toxin-antitoxin system RelB/DinJ family antitoxin [Pasteurella skyensis]MDP8172232.1 type II toxin-antitoxin system RelB/DinJ family antitoxin [Pasteurella skyensis]MDP8176419.1 type II toxin-antitoxin system RelB/DinJ family antitoxin [Pasteurella skyensis]MDP8178308.1 type II toxin-antitoxin system RelB/DinJ family antitoxin [Pasteurella skyensis]MDP8182936.1 type II toxin-antitoxin system
MATSNFNMRLDVQTKQQLDSILAGYGLTTAQAFKLFANQIIKTKKVPLSFDFLTDYEKNPVTMQAIDDARNGNLERFSSIDELMQAISE